MATRIDFLRKELAPMSRVPVFASSTLFDETKSYKKIFHQNITANVEAIPVDRNFHTINSLYVFLSTV